MRITVLGILFAMVVVFITYQQHTFLLPLFIGMLASVKGLVKLLTPKFAILLFKNSVFLKIKQLLIKASTRFFILSHKPWRHRIRWIKAKLSNAVLNTIRLYMNSPLWVRTAIALGLLFATASSSYIVIALLIIPQQILNWGKGLLFKTLNRLGITQLFLMIWKFFIPAHFQRRWYMHRKWTLGRRQVITARRLRDTIMKT